MAAGQATKVDDSAEPEIAGLIGCGVMAGLGAAMNTGGLHVETALLFGVAGSRDAAIEGSRIAGAHDHRDDLDDQNLSGLRILAPHT